MAMKTSKSWGLVVPGRPPTPSEGHAQTYARVGPADTQRLIAFDNGTCLSFGPDDLVDEFAPHDAFAEQVAMVDKAVRDCQSVSQRYAPTGDDDNRAYDGFRSKTLDFARLVKVSQPYVVHFQTPSKFASVGEVIPVYAQRRKNDIPGTAHPGSSVDTRFGMPGHVIQKDHQMMRRETDRDRAMGVRERDEYERKQNQRNARYSSRWNRFIKRGRRPGRENACTDDDHQISISRGGGASRMHESFRPSQSMNPTDNHRPFQVGNQQTAQHQNQQQQYGQNSILNGVGLPKPREIPAFASQYGTEFLSLSAFLPVPGRFNFDAVPPDASPTAHSRHLEYQILANAREAGLEGMFLNVIPDGYRGNSKVSIRPELVNHYYSHGLDRYYESEDAFLEEYFREQRERFNEEYLHRTDEEDKARKEAYHSLSKGERSAKIDSNKPTRDDGGVDDRVTSYAQPHYQTAQQGTYELGRYADQLNQQGPHPETGRLRGDAFVGAPTLPIHVTSPDGNILAAMAQDQALRHRAQNPQSIGSSARAAGQFRMGFSNFGPNNDQSTGSSDIGAISEDDITQRGRTRPSNSARARAADERRAGSGGQYISQPRQPNQMSSTILAPSGVDIFSREPSPVIPRSRFFDQSRYSSPGGSHLHARGRGRGSLDRSASAGLY